MMIDHWPLFGLRVRTPRLELRLPAENELAELADVAAAGVHEPGRRPFLTPWTDGTPADRARQVVQGHWSALGRWTPQDWTLQLVAFLDGRPVGAQATRAGDFAALREASSWSWLGLAHQGRGLGTQMRAAALHLLFAGLGATDVTSASFLDNPAPLAISGRLGYRPDGITRDLLHGRVVVSQRLRLTRDDWERVDRPPVTIEGLEPCLPLFGIGSEVTPAPPPGR
ncbi:GNAT family N-acetyltransferase [Plantactinospora siamensis]|uniref:GNAT family N-acetyltransferase n=1 Tax=Plantactinospora siamensis TaxID=555372 RepID=A0ABV6NXY8_9ACTN